YRKEHLAVSLPQDDVDLSQLRIRLWVVVAGVAASAFFPLDSGAGNSFRYGEKSCQIERQVPAGVVLAMAFHPHAFGSVLEDGELVKGFQQFVFSSDDPHQNVHAFLKVLLNAVGILRTGLVENGEGIPG